jgi:hypothetical protein
LDFLWGLEFWKFGICPASLAHGSRCGTGLRVTISLQFRACIRRGFSYFFRQPHEATAFESLKIMHAPFALCISLDDETDAEMRREQARRRALLRDENLSDLRRELHLCERRLGTAEECADDFDRARALAHEINNRVTIEYLRSVAPTSLIAV